MFKDSPTTLWTIRTTKHRRIECAARFVPIGVQVEIIADDWSIYSRIFPTGYEALVFADEERAIWTEVA